LIQSNIGAMNKYTLRFCDGATESRYLSATESARKLQMRLGLLAPALLYLVYSFLDQYVMPASVAVPATVAHLGLGSLICAIVFASLHFKSQTFHTSMVIASVVIAWLCHLTLLMMSATTALFGEAYLMLIWVWLVSGLSVALAARLNLLFIVLFEIAVSLFSPFSFAQMLSHQFFIFVALLLGGLGAYFVELYRRHNFTHLEKISEQASALEIARDQLIKDGLQLLKLSQAVEQSGEAILITDRHGVVDYVNPAFTRVTGCQPEDAIGMTPAFLQPDAQSPTDYKHMWDTIAGGERWHSALPGNRKDGSTYPAMISIAPIRDEGAHITHFVVTQTDLSEHQRLEDQLRQAQKMESIGTLVGGIAHDFNNMLAGITGNIYLAKAKMQESPALEKNLNNIEQLSFRAADMIQQMLAFARKSSVSMQQIDLTADVSDTLSFLRTSVPENIEFEHHVCPEELFIEGDSTQLHQVLMNLVNNARDAVEGRDQPRIILTLAAFEADAPFRRKHPDIKAGKYARLSIADNGHGIPEHLITRLFDPFFTTKEPGKGTGLGLAMTFGAVKTHHGIIEIESVMGKGSTFHIYLPLLPGHAATLAAETRHGIIKGKGETILLVDDDMQIIETTSMVLESLGYQVLTATNGQLAVEAYKAHAADIALGIFDVIMPVMSGPEAVAHIRRLNPQAKVIFSTGYDKNLLADMANETVACKPFVITELSQLLRKLLESQT